MEKRKMVFEYDGNSVGAGAVKKIREDLAQDFEIGSNQVFFC